MDLMCTRSLSGKPAAITCSVSHPYMALKTITFKLPAHSGKPNSTQRLIEMLIAKKTVTPLSILICHVQKSFETKYILMNAIDFCTPAPLPTHCLQMYVKKMLCYALAPNG